MNASGMTPTTPAATLTGFRVAVTDVRQHQVSADLRGHGAIVVDIPLLRIVPANQDARLRTATRRCVGAPPDYVVATSADGWQRWLDAAEAWLLKSALLTALSGASMISTGPAVSAALRASGLREASSPAAGTLAEVTDWLLRHDLRQRRVALAGDEASTAGLVPAIRARGADVIHVPTMRWAPETGMAPMHRLVRMVIQREAHAVTFTSTDAMAALVNVAERIGWRGSLLRAFATDVLVAGAAPASARIFVEKSIPALWARGGDGELATLVTAALVRRRREFSAGGVTFAVQGEAVFVDGTTTLLDTGPAAILRALADHPGAIMSRAALARLCPLPRGVRGTEVDLAVSRLRTALGEYGWLVATVARRGYRLASDPGTASP